ncbi:uncharacterized protein METZ01_LOCUS418745, partial [marine metagenome]
MGAPDIIHRYPALIQAYGGRTWLKIDWIYSIFIYYILL